MKYKEFTMLVENIVKKVLIEDKHTELWKLWDARKPAAFIEAWKKLSPEEKAKEISNAYEVAAIGRDPEWAIFFREIAKVDK